MNILLYIVDGYSASIRNPKSRIRTYFSDSIIKIIKNTSLINNVKIASRKATFFGIRDFKDDLLESGCDNLILCGKSYGVRMINRTFNRNKFQNQVNELFDKKYLLCVDGHYPFRFKDPIWFPSLFDHVYNIYQMESKPMIGARLSTFSRLTEVELIGKIDHWNIVEHETVGDFMKEIIKKLNES